MTPSSRKSILKRPANAGPARKHGVSRRMEILEDRRMLAAILFHNEGGSALWHDVGNWDLGRLPTDGDDVSIPANIGTVTFDGPDATVDSINALSPLSIQSGLLKSEESLALAAGSSLTVDGPQSVFPRTVRSNSRYRSLPDQHFGTPTAAR
ncbi:MAG: hypothetical protein AAFP69_15925, partial [Planctomycetota bacterium]